jgi:hypothetical protein
MCACDVNYVCQRCLTVPWRPDDRLIEGVWPDPDETDQQRRNDEMSAPDFEVWAA